MKKEFTRVNCNLLQADIYARNAQICGTCSHNYNATYKELRTLDTPTGIRQVLVDVPYPVTPESVKSYAVSADYRNDPAAAMAMPAPSANLGDLTDVQKVLSADMESARALYSNLKAVFDSQPATVATAAVANENTTASEVQNG